MNSLLWIGFAAFFVAALVVGTRLLLLWRRTRELPELLIGIGVLGIGPVGFGLITVSELVRAGDPALARLFAAVSIVAISAGVLAKYVFNWRVYHPGSRRLRRAVLLVGLLLAGCFVGDAARGFQEPHRLGPFSVLRTLLQIGCLLWGSAEALRWWTKMRRRLALGLAEPMVTNRFFLWGLGAGAAGVGSGIGFVAQLVIGRPTLEVPWILLSSSLHGLVAAVAMWLAFVPVTAYRRFIESRAARAVG